MAGPLPARLAAHAPLATRGRCRVRLARTLLTCCSAVALAAASAVPALADPPAGLTPRPGDVVGVGGDTVQFLLDQFSRDYNKANPGAATLLYSWDPADPVTGKTGGKI